MINAKLARRLTGLAVPAVLLIAIACGGEEQDVTPVPPTSAPPTTVATTIPPATPVPDKPRVYKAGIFAEPNTRNYWNFYGGPGGSVWTGYVLDGVATTLYDFSDQRFDWVPSLANGFPTELRRETIDGQQMWTSQVSIKKGAKWSDGVEITADDFVFVVNTVLGMQIGGNFESNVNADFVHSVEALDSHTVKVAFSQKPGLSVWQYGLAFTPILPKHYWEPVVTAAKASSSDVESMQAALFSHIPDGEPTAGGFVFKRWEPGAFYETESVANWYKSGIIVEEYENGAYREYNPDDSTYDVSYYGNPVGAKSLEFEFGPHVDRTVFIIYSDQDSAVLALTKGEIDYLFNSSGLDKGFQERIKAASDLALVSNPANSVRYLGFNTRKAPMDNKAFRQAVATVIDKEFVTNTVLQGAAIPAYSMVTPGNTFWHNPDVTKIGQGLDRAERIQEAVNILKNAGFTYEVEPQIGGDGTYVETPGKGLRMPDGTLVPELTILTPSSGYDPLRTTFGVWAERWLVDIGIPVSSQVTGFNNLIGNLFSPTVAEDLDMWIMGWSLRLFPDYLYDYFNSSNDQDGTGLNWGGYSNARFDQLSDELLSEATLEGAQAKIFELQEFLADELPYVVLFSPPITEAYRPSTVQFPYTSTLGGIQFFSGLQKSVLIE